MKIKPVIYILPLLLLCSCISTAPRENAPFASIQQLDELSGIYKNKGVTGEDLPAVYLSKIIWPSDNNLRHDEIEMIEVTHPATETIEVRAFSRNVAVKSSRFVENIDFKIKNGRLVLEDEAGIAGFKTGEPLVGPYHGSRELGIDSRGQGKYRSSFSVAGLVYLVVPIAMGGTDDVRFERIPSSEK